MKALSKTAAIKESKGSVSIYGARTSWTIVGPYRDNEPGGPTTESRADSYPKARLIATTWRARVALALMGKLDHEAAYAIDVAAAEYWADHSVEALLQAGIDDFDKRAKADAEKGAGS